MKTIPLSVYEHLFCLGVGLASLFLGIFVKFIPSRWFEKVKPIKEDIKTPEDLKKIMGSNLVLAMRRSTTSVMSKTAHGSSTNVTTVSSS